LIAIGQLLETQLSASLPSASYDFFGAAISSIYLAMAQYDEQVMVIRNEFVYAKETLEASLFLIPEIGVLENIFDSLVILTGQIQVQKKY
jgi:chemotaxis protein CheC